MGSSVSCDEIHEIHQRDDKRERRDHENMTCSGRAVTSWSNLVPIRKGIAVLLYCRADLYLIYIYMHKAGPCYVDNVCHIR